MTTDDAKPIIRTLHGVLLEARPVVIRATTLSDAEAPAGSRSAAAELLERLDGAIAEAEEVIA